MLNFWLLDSVAAKFIRSSMAPVETQPRPTAQPATSGGSKSCCPMFDSGESAEFTENPAQPISLTARTTISTGQLYRAYRCAGSLKRSDSSTVRTTTRMSYPLWR